MKTDYRFWEQNLNPITMQREPYISNANIEGEGDEQLRDERWADSIEKSRNNAKTKRVGKFW